MPAGMPVVVGRLSNARMEDKYPFLQKLRSSLDFSPLMDQATFCRNTFPSGTFFDPHAKMPPPLFMSYSFALVQVDSGNFRFSMFGRLLARHLLISGSER
jgi:hypothetical protein